jgi:hypothetical protein
MKRYGRSECLLGTRVDLLNFITAWVMNPSHNQNVLWLQGVAGSGKSSLSTTVASLFEETDRLGAFIFFNHNVAERSDPTLVIRTLAYKLASFDGRIGDAISAVIECNKSIADASTCHQRNKLLIEPLSSLENIQSG